MVRFWGADKFLSALYGRYLVYLAGGVGTGKTALAVALSGLLHQSGLVDATISNVPIAWAVPASEAPLARVCIVIDELGTWFSAREFGVNKSNEFRKTLLAFPRKLGSYVIVASRLNVDVSFRALSVQREYDLGFAQVYAFAEDEGQQQATGRFAVTGLSDLYRSPVVPPGSTHHPSHVSSYYPTLYIPSGIQFLADWVRRASAASKDDDEYDPNVTFDPVSPDSVFSPHPPRVSQALRAEGSPPVGLPGSASVSNPPGESVSAPGWSGPAISNDLDAHPLKRRL